MFQHILADRICFFAFSDHTGPWSLWLWACFWACLQKPHVNKAQRPRAVSKMHLIYCSRVMLNGLLLCPIACFFANSNYVLHNSSQKMLKHICWSLMEAYSHSCEFLDSRWEQFTATSRARELFFWRKVLGKTPAPWHPDKQLGIIGSLSMRCCANRPGHALQAQAISMINTQQLNGWNQGEWCPGNQDSMNHSDPFPLLRSTELWPSTSFDHVTCDKPERKPESHSQGKKYETHVRPRRPATIFSHSIWTAIGHGSESVMHATDDLHNLYVHPWHQPCASTRSVATFQTWRVKKKYCPGNCDGNAHAVKAN
jgi:hypothetical protein